MAKKQTKKAEVAQPEIKATNEMVEVVVEKPQPKKPKWEIKDRVYFLTGDSAPLTRIIKSSGIYYFDEEKGYERELMATENQRTPFVDEMEGMKRPARFIFRDGKLTIPRNKPVLQQILSLYHPKKDIAYYEYKPELIAEYQVEDIRTELDAMNAADSLSLDMAEAVMRAIIGSRVSEMSSKELRRDLLVQAKRNPALILDLIDDDNVMLRNIGIIATERNLLNLSSDQRTFTLGNTGRKLFTVPFDEHPYSALAAWFKTDEGMEILKGLEKRLNS